MLDKEVISWSGVTRELKLSVHLSTLADRLDSD